MSLQKDIDELLDAGVIDSDVATRINSYYASKSTDSTRRLFIIFGILGALLVGLGIILIIAHNWYDLLKIIKTLFAFMPLVICQLIGVLVLFRKSENIAWREGIAILIFFSVGASIALVSQIYQIPGDLSGYLITWSALSMPLIYVMRSSSVSLLLIAWVTFYACE
ncbi:MAG: DUF2157 domain-containing protein, partial [Marinoscillum sp.]